MTTVKVWTDEGYRTIASARQHRWLADEPIEDGGTDSGPTAVELLLGALGSCMVITTEIYARRKEWPLERVEVELEMERFKGADYPAYKGEAQFIHEIREKITLHGDMLTDEQRVRLLEISGKCPVRRVLTHPVFFTDLKPVQDTQ